MMLMKKIMTLLSFVLLFGLTSCIYIGLLPKELKKHNQKIIEQLPEFPQDNYSGEFYYFPEDKDLSIEFTCKDGKMEYFIKTADQLFYMDGVQEKSYTIETKEEHITSEIRGIYQETYEEIKQLLSIIHNYDGGYSKAEGIRGYNKIEEEIFDEVDHYVYDMDWKYSSVAMFVFYVSEENSDLHSFWLRDISNDEAADVPHFRIDLYKDSSSIENLENAYETWKQYAE